MDSRYMIRRAEVLSVYDDAEGLRIKVRIPYFDPPKEEDPNMERIPYCFPLMPKLIHVNPKVGELVLDIVVMKRCFLSNHLLRNHKCS